VSVAVLRADAAHIPLPDESVDLIVTSPPYFGLRSYIDAGQHYEAQIGSEATPQKWLDALLTCTKDWIRVLKPSGSMFVNLGDKYAGNAAQRPQTVLNAPQSRQVGKAYRGLPEKSLLGLPWRYALACTDQLGLILRRDIVWDKPNGLPESVTDRCRSSHEYLFHLTRLPRYYAAVDEIREPHNEPNGRPAYGRPRPVIPGGNRGSHVGIMDHAAHRDMGQHPLGKLPGSVWSIPSQPLQVPPHLGVDHFAAFPMELPRRCVLGWSPPGVCTRCGQGRRPTTVADQEHLHTQRRTHGFADLARPNGEGAGVLGPGVGLAVTRRLTTITGYACACPQPDAPTRPSVVLDPFGGTGTTALVAHMLGRVGVSVDRSADYSRIAAWRTTDPAERAKALQVPKPPPVSDGQEALFPL